jgi:hypothetical protein
LTRQSWFLVAVLAVAFILVVVLIRVTEFILAAMVDRRIRYLKHTIDRRLGELTIIDAETAGSRQLQALSKRLIAELQPKG